MKISNLNPQFYIPENVPPVLSKSLWYWGKISKQEVNSVMKNAPDGAFLVRDSTSNKDEYTLTVRMRSCNGLVRIIEQGDMYGFDVPCRFASVVDLINYHRQESLKVYNRTLDTCLVHPINRPESIEEELLRRGPKQLQDELRALTNEQKKLSEECLFRREKERALDQHIRELVTYITCLEEASCWLTCHKKLQETFQKSVQPHELEGFSENMKVLSRELVTMEELKKASRLKLSELKREFDDNEEKVVHLCSSVQSVIKRMSVIRGVQRKKSICDVEQLHSIVFDESSWYLSNITREEAEGLLHGKPDGTFLIRKSTRGGHALSIACMGIVHHCLILEGERGIGFTEPFIVFHSMQDLVRHYTRNSLEEHNDLLRTTLNYPVYK